jgi:hypothetical protein
VKILFLSPAKGMDYQCDTTLIGLKLLFGSDVVDVNKVEHIYDTFPDHLVPFQYGKGFTICKTVDDLEVDRNDIDAKIISNYFDIVVYGAIWRCTDKFELVIKHYPKNKIIAIDGEEPPNPEIHPYSNYTTYFKRELYQDYKDINPIQFSFPDLKFKTNTSIKTKTTAFITPTNPKTYIYNNEQDYYNGYAKSLFAITTKKGGWDCMRHYEILGNRCIPLFIDIKNCPSKTLHCFPKKELECIYNTINFYNDKIELKETENFYNDKIEELAEYTKNNLLCSTYTLKNLIHKIT